jgi:hypothetical protein
MAEEQRTQTQRPRGSGAALGMVGIAAKSRQIQHAQMTQLDELLIATDRTNQLLEWIGSMMHVQLTPEQRAEMESWA